MCIIVIIGKLQVCNGRGRGVSCSLSSAVGIFGQASFCIHDSSTLQSQAGLCQGEEVGVVLRGVRGGASVKQVETGFYSQFA